MYTSLKQLKINQAEPANSPRARRTIISAYYIIENTARNHLSAPLQLLLQRGGAHGSSAAAAAACLSMSDVLLWTSVS